MTVLKDISSFFSIETLSEISGGVISYDEVKEVLINLSQDKLYKKGEDSQGTALHTDKSISAIGGGIYSPSNEKNYQQDFVDLYQSGEFYRSFKVIAQKTFFELKADFQKDEGNIYDNFEGSYSNFETFENMILGLQESDLDVFIEKIFLPNAISLFIKTVQNAI